MASAGRDRRHHVRLYEDTAVLAEQVGRYLCDALQAGGSALAVARPLTLAVIEVHLAKAGNDVASLRAEGRLALLDAEDLLPKLMQGNLIERAAFDEHVAPAVRSAASIGGRRQSTSCASSYPTARALRLT